MARKALVTFDFPSAPTVGGVTTWYVTPTGTNASGTWGISVTGNAGTATTLQTARNINGTSFNGSANITVAEPTFSGQLSVYTQTDANTFTGGLTARYLTSGATNKPTGTDHALLTMAYSSDWAVQLAGDWRTNTWYSRTEQSGTWGSWVTMISSANYNTYSPTLTGTGATGTWGISVTGNAGTATLLQANRTINGVIFNGSGNVTIPRVNCVDDRAIAPADGTERYITGFFTSWANNSTSPYADALLFRSYGDGTAGNDNLLMVRRDALGMRLWQQTYGSTTPFASFKDIAWTDGTNATGTWSISTTGSSATLTTARTLTIGATGKTFNGSANVSWTVAEIGAVGTSGNETITGNKTFSGTTALSATSTINGAVIGFRDVPVTISNANTTFALADAGKAFGKDNTTAYTYTIPANGTVAFPIGTVITVFNNNATSNITVAITTDTLRLAGTTTTGSRTIAPFALCTLFKVSSTVWMASGAGVT